MNRLLQIGVEATWTALPSTEAQIAALQLLGDCGVESIVGVAPAA
ncbi:hypothetical protein [Bradyrhizobium sp. USDA 10063]